MQPFFSTGFVAYEALKAFIPGCEKLHACKAQSTCMHAYLLLCWAHALLDVIWQHFAAPPSLFDALHAQVTAHTVTGVRRDTPHCTDL